MARGFFETCKTLVRLVAVARDSWPVLRSIESKAFLQGQPAVSRVKPRTLEESLKLQRPQEHSEESLCHEEF